MRAASVIRLVRRSGAVDRWLGDLPRRFAAEDCLGRRPGRLRGARLDLDLGLPVHRLGRRHVRRTGRARRLGRPVRRRPPRPVLAVRGAFISTGGALDARNLEGPIAIARLAGHRDLAVQSGEAEHLDVDIPNAGGEFEGIAAVLAGIGNDFGAALPCGNRGAGNELVGGPDGAAVLRGG